MSFISKLKINPEQEVVLLNVPAHLLPAFSFLKYRQSFPKTEKATQVIFFAFNKMMLEKNATTIINNLTEDGLLWIAYPKKSGAIQSDLIRDEGWQMMYDFDWEGVASIAIDNDWSGIRFRHKNATKSLKRLPPIEARNTEGIDYINRIVKLPKDAVAMMQPHKELENFFYSMAFTHKKEYVAAIEDAKKPETRHRRIEKMIEMLLKLKAQKETKAKHK